jgi:hypothetical protein
VTSLTIIGYNVIMTTQWIGMVGRNGSGKSSACDYLGKKGFQVVSLSDVVRYHAKKDHRPEDRDTLTQLANELKTARGLAYFAKASMAHVTGQPRVVFDSIRHPDEVHELKKNGVFLMGIDADLEDCYTRIQSRGKGTDFVSFEAFKAQDDYEMSGQSHGQRIMDCLDLCDVRIENNRDLAHLFDRIDSALATHSIRPAC